jgi:hypothetical protein
MTAPQAAQIGDLQERMMEMRVFIGLQAKCLFQSSTTPLIRMWSFILFQIYGDRVMAQDIKAARMEP